MLQLTSIASLFQSLVPPVGGAEANRETPRPGAFEELLGDAEGRDAGTFARAESTAVDSQAAATLARVLEQLLPAAAPAGVTHELAPSGAAVLGGDVAANLALESGSGRTTRPGEPPISHDSQTREPAGFESHNPIDAAPLRGRTATPSDGPVTGRAAKSVPPEQLVEAGTSPQPDAAGGDPVDDGRVTGARRAVRGTDAAPPSEAAGTNPSNLPNSGAETPTTRLATGREAKPLVAFESKLPVAHESIPQSAPDTKPRVTGEALPPNAREAKPLVAGVAKPVADQAKPWVTGEALPPNAREAKPLVAGVAKPVADQAKPMSNHEARPPVANETLPPVTREAKPLVADDAKPIAHQADPVAVQDTKSLGARAAKPLAGQDAVHDAKPQVGPLTVAEDNASSDAGRTAPGRVAQLPGEADALATTGRMAHGREAIVEVAHRESERSTTKSREARPARTSDGDAGRQVEIPRPTMDWETSRAIRRLQATLDVPETRQDAGHRRATDGRSAPEGDDPADATTRSSRPAAATGADTGSAAQAGRDRAATDAPAGRVAKAAAGQTGVGEPAAPSAGGREVEQQAPLRDIPRVDYRSLVDAIVSRARELPQNGSIAVKFALNPEELGQVLVRIESHGDRVKIRILAASRAAMEALGAGASRLAVQMADAGFGETEIDLGYESPDTENFAHQREAAQEEQAQRERGSRSAAPEANESRTFDTRSRSTSRLDRVA